MRYNLKLITQFVLLNSWDIEIGPDFPVVYYIDSCNITDSSGNFFPVILDGCLSILSATKSYQKDIYSQSEMKYSFRKLIKH